MNKRLLALTIGLLLAAGGAMAAETGEPQAQAPDFRKLDTNNDGYISYSEAVAGERYMEALKDNYQEADRNDDGRVDQAEFAAFEAEPEYTGDLPPGLQTDDLPDTYYPEEGGPD